MCLIVFAYKYHPNYPLILAENRDEFHSRPTQQAHWWDGTDILAGRDLQAGGTWCGITGNGRLAAVTNYRKFPLEGDYESSRGELVMNFLLDKNDPTDYLRFLEQNKHSYAGYSLLFGSVDELHYFSNRSGHEQIGPGIYGISNHLLDTPWPKIVRAKQLLKDTINSQKDNVSTDSLISILSDKKHAPDDQLPDTGIGLEWEKKLSSIFIEGKEYGTRSSSVILIDQNGVVTYRERSYTPLTDQTFQFEIDSDSVKHSK